MALIVPTVLRFNRVTIKNLYQINQNGLRSGKQLKMVRQNRNSKFSEISAVSQHKSRRLLYVPSAFSWQRQYFNTIIEQKKPDNTNVSSMQKVTKNLKKLRIEFQFINKGLIKERNDFLKELQHQLKRALAEIELLKKKYPEPNDTNICHKSAIEEATEDLRKLGIEVDLIKIEFAKLFAKELKLCGYVLINKYTAKIRDFFLLISYLDLRTCCALAFDWYIL